MAIIVKVGTVPGRLTEVTLDDDSNVGEAIEIAGFDASKYLIQLNGSSANVNSDVDDGDVISLLKNINGAQ